VNRRQCLCLVASTFVTKGSGLTGALSPNEVRMRTVARQTLGFELPQLPGEEFRIAIPELISDKTQAILPWGFASPDFEIEKNLAQLHLEVPGRVRMEAKISFLADRIEARVWATNLSALPWDGLNAFTCFACYKASSFHDPRMVRTYIPGNDSKTFFGIANGPKLKELWACRQLRQHHATTASGGCACLVSSGGKWVAGIAAAKAAYLFNNREKSCIHADPIMGDVPPGGTAEGLSTVYIFPGTKEDFMERCLGV
jgi:hypothetical protein